MLIGTDAIKTVVPVYHLIRPSPSEMQVCKCWGQIFKRSYLILGATNNTGHIVQDLSQHPQLPLQHIGRIYCLQMGSAQTSNPVQEAAHISPRKMMATRSQASPYSRLQALCLVNFLLRNPSPGPSAGLWCLYANPSPQNCSQGGGDGAHVSNTWVVTVLGLWETRVTFLPLPMGMNVPNSHIPPMSLGNSQQRVCMHRILIMARPKTFFLHCGD